MAVSDRDQLLQLLLIYDDGEQLDLRAVSDRDQLLQLLQCESVVGFACMGMRSATMSAQ